MGTSPPPRPEPHNEAGGCRKLSLYNWMYSVTGLGLKEIILKKFIHMEPCLVCSQHEHLPGSIDQQFLDLCLFISSSRAFVATLS